MNSVSITRVVVDLAAYRHNLQQVRSLIPRHCEILAVVKSNAYGHGAVQAAGEAQKAGAGMLGVANVSEGIELREAGITGPVLVLSQPPETDLHAAIEHDLRVMVSTVACAERLGELARRVNKVVPIHCKIDSGMGRQGFALEEAPPQLLQITRVSHVDIEGVATHFPSADVSDDVYTNQQIRAMRSVLVQLDKFGIPYEFVHAANSAAVINYPSAAFSMVRPGLMTYGVWPTNATPGRNFLKPVLRWEATITLVKYLEPGSSISYGRKFTTQTRMRAAIVPVGYGSGYRHALSNKADVLIRGRRCPVRGSVCMDQMVVDVSDLASAEAGDTVTLIGRDGDEEIRVEELAERAGAIPYEILTGISARLPRQYVG